MFDAQLAYPQVGLEEIIIRHPDVVIELRGGAARPVTVRCDRQMPGLHRQSQTTQPGCGQCRPDGRWAGKTTRS